MPRKPLSFVSLGLGLDFKFIWITIIQSMRTMANVPHPNISDRKQIVRPASTKIHPRASEADEDRASLADASFTATEPSDEGTTGS